MKIGDYVCPVCSEINNFHLHYTVDVIANGSFDKDGEWWKKDREESNKRSEEVYGCNGCDNCPVEPLHLHNAHDVAAATVKRLKWLEDSDKRRKENG